MVVSVAAPAMSPKQSTGMNLNGTFVAALADRT